MPLPLCGFSHCAVSATVPFQPLCGFGHCAVSATLPFPCAPPCTHLSLSILVHNLRRVNSPKTALGPLLLCASFCACGTTTEAGSTTPELQAPKPILGETPVLTDRAPYRFLVGGHLYGAPGIARLHPSVNLRAHLDALKGSADFFVSLGDFVMTFAPALIDPTLEDLRKLEMPVFNAVGNHDYTRPELYEFVCAPTYGSFLYGRDLFIILNTEQIPWQIQGEQLAALKGALALGTESETVRNIFIFGHRLLFACADPRYATLFEHHNDKPRYDGSANFETDIRPLLTASARSKAVFWFAGDLGAAWTDTLFYDEDPRSGVTYIATGLGDRPDDCLLRIAVDHAGAVTFQSVSLSTEQIAHPQVYGIPHWRRQYEHK